MKYKKLPLILLGASLAGTVALAEGPNNAKKGDDVIIAGGSTIEIAGGQTLTWGENGLANATVFSSDGDFTLKDENGNIVYDVNGRPIKYSLNGNKKEALVLDLSNGAPNIQSLHKSFEASKAAAESGSAQGVVVPPITTTYTPAA